MMVEAVRKSIRTVLLVVALNCAVIGFLLLSLVTTPDGALNPFYGFIVVLQSVICAQLLVSSSRMRAIGGLITDGTLTILSSSRSEGLGGEAILTIVSAGLIEGPLRRPFTFEISIPSNRRFGGSFIDSSQPHHQEKGPEIDVRPMTSNRLAVALLASLAYLFLRLSHPLAFALPNGLTETGFYNVGTVLLASALGIATTVSIAKAEEALPTKPPYPS